MPTNFHSTSFKVVMSTKESNHSMLPTLVIHVRGETEADDPDVMVSRVEVPSLQAYQVLSLSGLHHRALSRTLSLSSRALSCMHTPSPPPPPRPPLSLSRTHKRTRASAHRHKYTHTREHGRARAHTHTHTEPAGVSVTSCLQYSLSDAMVYDGTRASSTEKRGLGLCQI